MKVLEKMDNVRSNLLKQTDEKKTKKEETFLANNTELVWNVDCKFLKSKFEVQALITEQNERRDDGNYAFNVKWLVVDWPMYIPAFFQFENSGQDEPILF